MQTIERVLKGIFREKCWNKYIKPITYQLYSMELKYKLGFLFDFWKVDVKNLENLLIELRREAIKCDIVLVEVGDDDVCLFNLDFFLENVNDENVFINISGNLQNPEIITDVKMLESIKSQLLNFSKRENPSDNLKITLELTKDCCVPTVFGFLIGYPALYYYNPEITDENCLGNVDLKVFQLYYKDNLLISYSVPLSLYSSVLKSTIEKWLEFYNRLEDFKIEIDIRNYPSLVL